MLILADSIAYDLSKRESISKKASQADERRVGMKKKSQ
jgi:hypothetical protein